MTNMTEPHFDAQPMMPPPFELFKKLAIVRNNVSSEVTDDVLETATALLKQQSMQWMQYVVPHENDRWQIVTIFIDNATGQVVELGGAIRTGGFPMEDRADALALALGLVTE